MSDDAVMRWLGDSVRRKGYVPPDESGSMDEFYEHEQVDDDYAIDIFFPTSIASAQFFQPDAFAKAEADVPKFPAGNMILLTAEQNAWPAPAQQREHSFWANASLRHVNWTTVGAGMTTGAGIPWAEWIKATPELGSLSITNLGDIDLAASAGLPTSLEQHVNFLLTRSKLSYSRDLADRLIEIARDLRDYPEDAISLSEASVASLISFLEVHPKLARPQLAPTTSGLLVARWRSQAHSVTVNIFFLPGKSVQYYISTPNTEDPDDIDWDSGATTANSLPDKLERHGVWRWMHA